MSENKFNIIRVKNLHILENEAFVRKHGLHQLSDRNKKLAFAISQPLMILAGGATGFLLSLTIVERDFSDTLLYTIFGLAIGYPSSIFLGLILHTILNAKRMDTEQHEAYTMTENFTYPANLDLQLDTLSTPYVSEDNAVSFGYEYIDMKESSSNMLILNIPAELKSADVLKKKCTIRGRPV